MNASPVIHAGSERPAGEEVRAALHGALQRPADPEHERKIDDDHRVVDGAQC